MQCSSSFWGDNNNIKFLLARTTGAGHFSVHKTKIEPLRKADQLGSRTWSHVGQGKVYLTSTNITSYQLTEQWQSPSSLALSNYSVDAATKADTLLVLSVKIPPLFPLGLFLWQQSYHLLILHLVKQAWCHHMHGASPPPGSVENSVNPVCWRHLATVLTCNQYPHQFCSVT